MSYPMMTFYQFMPIFKPAAHQLSLKKLGTTLNLKGTLILSPEGLNASLTGEEKALQDFCQKLKTEWPAFAPKFKVAHSTVAPFARFKVLVKPEIVTLKERPLEPYAAIAVDPKAWHALIDQHDVCLIDTRNDFEVALGSFPEALDPKTRTFSEFKEFVREKLDPAQQPKLALFCTGGIRCEKVAPYLKAQGFHEIYQLQGGILNYLAQMKGSESRFAGDCFVFDERTSVNAASQGLHPEQSVLELFERPGACDTL